MNFMETLLEMLLEGKIDDVLDKHTSIPHNVKQDYLKQIPANNAQHLDWVLQQHTKGNIKPEHNIHSVLSTFNKVKDKLAKKQIGQYKSLDELHTAVLPHADGVKQSDNEKSSSGTETLYDTPTMTIKQHHNYESAISAANLPESNHHEGKAGWCVSVGNGGGASHHASYTANGFHPVYTIEHKYPDGSTSRHMLVYNHNKTQDQQELRNESDFRPGFSDYSSTRSDLLDHEGVVHPELLKTPIAHLFSEDGREKYKKSAAPKQEKLKKTLAAIPKTGMTDEEYMSNFKAGQEKQQGGIHNELAKSTLSSTQLDHLIKHGNAGSMHDIASRQDLSEDQMHKLANTSNMLVHHRLLHRPNLPDKTFNVIVKKAHSQLDETILKHSKFKFEHLNDMVSKSKTPTDITPFITAHGSKLDSDQVSHLLKTADEKTTNALIKHSNKQIDDDHIKEWMDTGSVSTQQQLLDSVPERLDKDHIETLVKHDNPSTHALLAKKVPHMLKTEHINNIIAKGNGEYLIKHAPDILDKDHIETLVKDKSTHALLAEKVPHMLKTEHIDNIIAKGNGEHLIKHAPDKLEPHHIKKLLTRANDLNDAYPKLSEDSKKVLVAHAQSLKDDNNSDWVNLTNTHKQLNLNKIDIVKQHIHDALNGPIGQVRHDLTDDEIKTHIHPIIDKHIAAAEGSARKSGRALVTFASMINKDQTSKLLSSISSNDDLPYAYGTNLPTHVRDTIIDHSIKTNNPKLLANTLEQHRYTDDVFSQPHIEHIKANHPAYMPRVDPKGIHAKSVADTAIKNNDTKTLESLANSGHRSYQSAVLKHTVNSDNAGAIISHLHSGTVSHEDLDKILFREHEKGYKGKKSDDIIRAVSIQADLHSRHIDHIIKSGNVDAIKNIVGGGGHYGYYAPRQNLSSKHIDRIIKLKNKDISRHLADYRDGLNPVQQFNNSKVLKEGYLSGNFQTILKESLISKSSKTRLL